MTDTRDETIGPELYDRVFDAYRRAEGSRSSIFDEGVAEGLARALRILRDGRPEGANPVPFPGAPVLPLEPPVPFGGLSAVGAPERRSPLTRA